MDPVTTVQPLAVEQINTRVILLESGPVTVRQLTETEEDREFAAKVMIEAFEGKVIHATSRGSVPDVRVYYVNSLRGRMPVFYERNFIAEYDGQKAGSCVIRYHGDRELFPQRDEDMPPVGCTDMCGLFCMGLASKFETYEPGKCCVDHIGVNSEFRGKGIGKVLLDMAEVDAKKKGCKAIYLFVASTNRAQHLYERQGYVIKDRRTICCCGYWCMTGEREFARMEKML